MKTSRANVIARELRRIAKRCGGVLKPEIVVEEARPKSSPIHNRFEWDDSAAAQHYRIWQARMLIRVCVQKLPGIKTPVDVFVSLSSDRAKGDGYRIMTDVLSDEDMKAEMLSDAMAELEIFRIKYRRLKELAGVFAAISKVSR